MNSQETNINFVSALFPLLTNAARYWYAEYLLQHGNHFKSHLYFQKESNEDWEFNTSMLLKS